MSLAPALARPDVRFDDAVRLLLEHKGSAVWSVTPDTTVYQAIEIMAEKHIGALLVISCGQLTGVITERDYARKVILRGRNSHTTQVREVMTSPVLFVTPGQTVDQCLHLMTERRVRHLPVMDGSVIEGVVSMGDLVNWIVQHQQQTIDHLRSYIAGGYPG